MQIDSLNMRVSSSSSGCTTIYIEINIVPERLLEAPSSQQVHSFDRGGRYQQIDLDWSYW